MICAAASPRIVLVPGGFTGAWMWADVVAPLERDGIEALAVELPTVGEGSAGADFYADAASVREVLDRFAPPVVLYQLRVAVRNLLRWASPRRRP